MPALQPAEIPAAMGAAYDLIPAMGHHLDRLEHAYLVCGLADRGDLRLILPTGHPIPEGATLLGVPIVWADVPAPMVAQSLR